MEELPRKSVSDIMQSLGTVALPIDSLMNPNFHIFVTTPYLKERMAHINLKDAATATAAVGADIYLTSKIALQGMQNHAMDPESFDVLPTQNIPQTFSFIRKLMRIGGIYTFAVNTWTYINSFHFFGVQPQPFKGFTCYLNKNLDSNEDSQMHYALSPTEFILYGQTVKSCSDGVVTEVRMDQNDQIRNKPPVEFGSWKVDQHLGNLIRVAKGYTEITYAGLMKNSARVKVGDTIRKGQPLARVGCSAWSPIPFLYLQFGIRGARLPFIGNAAPAFRHQSIKWDGFLQCRLFKSPVLDKMKNHTDIFREVDPTNIKYDQHSITLLDGSLVKSYRSIGQTAAMDYYLKR